MRSRLALAAFAAYTAAHAFAQTPITVQVVNDSGRSDYEIFLLLTGKSVTNGAGTTYPFSVSGVANVDANGTSPTTGAPLSCTQSPSPSCTTPITASSLTVNSPYTGRQNLPVYTFTMSTVGSGVLYVSYDQGVTYPHAPTVRESYRFQPLEFSYSDQIVSNGDLTSIDFYGIPLELTTYAAGDTAYRHALDRVTYYSSTDSIISAFLDVDSTFASALVGRQCNPACSRVPFVPGTSYRDFLRIVGPNQVAAPGTSPLPSPPPANTSPPWPYPSFAAYLDRLASTSYTWKEKDSAIVSAYSFDYTGTITAMSSTTTANCLSAGAAVDGWLLKLTGTTTPSDASLPSNAEICIPLARAAGANNSADFVIYGATQSCESLSIYDPGTQRIYSCTDGDDSLKKLANSVYGWIQADVLSALNFGYMQGNADDQNGVGHSGVWYNLPPVRYPFALARKSNDGYYNPWAALMYNHSDAYGFAFSDRKGRPSPDIGFPIGGTLRVWILPDSRLDAPKATATPGPASIALSWPAVPDADHYAVTWSPPYATASKIVRPPQVLDGPVTTTIDNLTGGTPYMITVRALNADESKGSVELPLYTRTTGDQPPAPAGNAQGQFTFNWTPPAELFGTAIPDLYIAGTKYSYAVSKGAGTYTAAAPTPIVTGPVTASVPLTVTGPGLAVLASIAPAPIAPNGVATMTITLGSPALASLTPSSAFTVAAPLGVTFSPVPVTLAAGFSPAAMAAGQSSTLTARLGNSSATPVTLTSAFTMTLPPGASTASQNIGTCPGVAVSGASITMAQGSAVPANGCTIAFAVTSSTLGTAASVTTALQTSAGGAPAVGAALTVTGSGPAVEGSIAPPVLPPGGSANLALSLSEATQGTVALAQPFTITLPPGVAIATSATSLGQGLSPATVAQGGSVTLTITLGNASAAPISLTAPFTDQFPAGVSASPLANAGTCTGVTVTASGLVMPAGGTIPVGGCTIVVALTVASPAAGSLTNSTSALATSAGNAPASSAGLTVTGATPAVTMALGSATLAPGGNTTLTVTLNGSPGSNLDLTGAFIVTMPAGLTLASGTQPSNSCIGASVQPTQIVVGAVPQNSATCVINAVVTAAASASGDYLLTSGQLETSAGTAPGASAPLAIASGTTCPSVTMSSGGITMAAGASFPGSGCTIAAKLVASAAGMQIVTTSPLTTTNGKSGAAASLPLNVVSPPCPGVVVSASNITTGTASVPSGTCTITAGVSASQPGTTVIATSGLATAAGNALPATAPLTVTGASSNVVAQISPPAIGVNGSATLTLTLLNHTGSAVGLTEDFVDVVPPPLQIKGAAGGTCPGVSVSGNTLTMARGSLVAGNGGCTIVVALTSPAAGSFTSTTGPLLTSATVYPVQSFPMELRSGGETIWYGNYYLTFIGSPQRFSVGPCAPDATCAGSGPAYTLPPSTPRSPNFLERQGVDLAISGGSSGEGPPFGGAALPTVGVSFTPIANKQYGAIVTP